MEEKEENPGLAKRLYEAWFPSGEPPFAWESLPESDQAAFVSAGEELERVMRIRGRGKS